MPRSRGVSVLMSLLVATSATGVALVATSGESQALKPSKGPTPYYLSLGDSYSIGYQPNAPGTGGTPGYTAYVAGKLKMNLENFGCGGATTSSMLSSTGCGDPAATNAVAYPSTTQETAAIDFIEAPANAGLVKLVTVSIGGNDITSCIGAGSESAITTCVSNNATAAETNIKTLVGDLTAALNASSDTNARIIGLTYPDVILGQYVNPGGASAISLANLSVLAFDDIVNPDFSAAYESVADGRFVNVTSAKYQKAREGDDTPLTRTTLLAPYGKIPRAVWEICTITWYCQQQNIHANTLGYQFIGKLVATAYKAG
jgi:lysophospholipase L1-like esterase